MANLEAQKINSSEPHYEGPRCIQPAEKMRKLSLEIRDRGTVCYYDDIMDAVGKGKTFIDLDYQIVQKSIDKLEAKGYKVETFDLPPLPPEEVNYPWIYHRISW